MLASSGHSRLQAEQANFSLVLKSADGPFVLALRSLKCINLCQKQGCFRNACTGTGLKYLA